MTEPNSGGGSYFVEHFSRYNLTILDKLATSNYTTGCEDAEQAAQQILNPPIVTLSCKPPLLQYNGTDRQYALDTGVYFTTNNSNCVVNCPAPIFTLREWSRIFTLSEVLSYLSFITSLFMVITYGILNKKKTRFDRINLCFLVSLLMMSVSGMIVSINGTEKTVCPTVYRSATFSDAPCTASAFILHIFALSSIQWWAIIAFEVWFTIRKVGAFQKDMMKYYLPVTISLSLIFPIIALARKRYHAGIGNVFCWLDSSAYQTALFFVPMGLFLLIGAVFMILLMYEIYKIVSATSTSKGKNASIEILKMEIRPIVGIVLYFSLFISTVPLWFECALRAADPYECTVKGPTAAGIGYFIFCVRICAIYAFLLSGLSKRTFEIWRSSFLLNNKLFKLISTKVLSMASTTFNGSSKNDTIPSAPSHIVDSRNSIDTYSAVVEL
ncbi:hypothetical protein SAMD00019534_021190 [Acytostelium subglobosum LB1]|uniref:hypothetical protein n=1 Tax=Acytostelium subglobosum LB1 TaxID=1410327 RepID=UPI000644CF1D|nr:hypothetical protein SAMD00019534_021190 [Acytostelium subglobosum LB1]GAM18944.1 hypothetical protein SAMD00019534_021190 [Acytostelium subglobosum LB1]|eukprot:XP_012758164.1 hypothetical protein SAMD00019534_021190 [Acytostelium subglobosum LB1]